MKKNNIFWISYSDLMTSLFFIMLVLFVLTIGFLSHKFAENENLITALHTTRDSLQRSIDIVTIENERYEKLLRLEDQFKPLEESGIFDYWEECQKYVIKDLIGKEIFEPTKTVILPEFIPASIRAGRQIEQFLKNLIQENPDLSYLLVIEGNMANFQDYRMSKDNIWGYKTSYERALALYQLWNDYDINFRNYNVEVLICGSGFNGLCRETGLNKPNNKRFSVQIIPKVSNQAATSSPKK